MNCDLIIHLYLYIASPTKKVAFKCYLYNVPTAHESNFWKPKVCEFNVACGCYEKTEKQKKLKITHLPKQQNQSKNYALNSISHVTTVKLTYQVWDHGELLHSCGGIPEQAPSQQNTSFE